jgi:hypothetical protein
MVLCKHFPQKLVRAWIQEQWALFRNGLCNCAFVVLAMSVSRAILEQIKRLIPPLDGSLHKGQSGTPVFRNQGNQFNHFVGRVGVLGGALE